MKKNFLKKLKFLFLGFILLISFNSKTLAQSDYGFTFSKAGSAGLQFLKIGIGARETAMGEAVTAVVDNANAVFWNAAGIAFVKNKQVTASYNQWLVDSKHSSVAAAFPIGEFVIALSASSFSINDFEETTALNPEGTGRMVSAGDLLIGLAAARNFTDRLSIGVQVKYVREKLDDLSFDDVLFDVGAIYYTGFRNLRLGFTLQHFGPDIKLVNQEFRTPLLFRVSAADEAIQTEDFSLTTSVDLVHPTDNNEWVNFGGELKIFKTLFLRAGYRLNQDIGNLSFGAGIETPQFSSFKVKFDYAFIPAEDVFNAVHRFTVGLEF